MADNMRDNNRKPVIEHWMKVTVYLIIYDAVSVTLSYFLALMLRLDFVLPATDFMMKRKPGSSGKNTEFLLLRWKPQSCIL